MPEVKVGRFRRDMVAFQAIVTKEIIRFMRIWLQTLLPSTVTMSLYFVVFGRFIGTKIEKMDGVEYIAFIVPGLVMMAVITNSYSNVVSSFFGAKFQRHVEEMLVSPTSNVVIIVGYVVGGVARGLIVGCLVTAVALFFTKLKIHSLTITLSVIVLTAVLFAIGGFINALFARKFDDISIVPTFILTPLTYLGGVFYSISLLPDHWRVISMANPILYMVNAFRYGILGQSDIDIGIAFVVILAFIAGSFVAALVMMRRGIGLRT